jgi:type II secretory pathway pseudopilin PulG
VGRRRRSLLSPGDTTRGAHRPLSERSGEAGYALTELLVVTALLAVVLGAILALAETTQRIAPKENERAMVIREAQVGLHRMTKELRHAVPTPTVTGSRMQAEVLTTSGTRVVSYECDHAHPTDPAYTRCLRYLVNGTAKTGGDVIVDRVLNGTGVFTATGANYVRVAVEVAARGDLKNGYDHSVVLDDAIYMRNLDG